MRQKPEKDPHGTGPSTTVEVAGTIEHFRFRNGDTGFAVVRFAQDGGGSDLTAVGQLAQLAEGQRVKLTGTLVDHPRFGPQIQVEVAEAIAPTTVEGIKAYLSSSLIKGIGPQFAERITDTFGEDTLRVIEQEPERLREVKGLGRKRSAELVAAVLAQRDVQEVMVFLRTHGLGQALAVRIVKRYGKGASALIQADPYRLVDDVIGVGFRTADELARRMGIEADAPHRIRAGVQHCLTLAAREGHCHLPEEELVRKTAELLQCDLEAVALQLPELQMANKVVAEQLHRGDGGSERVIYPLLLHQAEHGAAIKLRQLVGRGGPPLPFDAAEEITRWERATGMSLPVGQRTAVLRALQEPVSVITGGPGVGKTTIIRALADIMSRGGLDVRLAAPTGRAAKRLEESTDRAASTVHRLLEFQPGSNRFLRDEKDPIDAHLLVVDETSMLDIQLAWQLLRAVRVGTKLVLVGDVHQLPSVGPGSVLADIIDSGKVAVTHLTEIFRQKEGSAIVLSAHGILRGEVPVGGGEGSDFYLVETQNSQQAREVIRKIVVERIPQAFDLDPINDVQVLCPMYRGHAGADAINRDLQEALNRNTVELERGNHRFRLRDKVMQIRNDYDLDVFNGDTGRIERMDQAAGKVTVRFGSRVVEYTYGELDNLVPAYAISVHRSQGSEYPAVVMPVCTDHFMMLKRNLVYTAITRARRLMVLVGSSKALRMAVDNVLESKRYTNLAPRIAGG